MRALATGEVLEVLADDPGVKLDLPAWCKANRQRLLALDEERADGRRLYRASIQKTGEQA
jgi:TusA-related sulfurtransferase